jgi:hypothetical protein
MKESVTYNNVLLYKLANIFEIFTLHTENVLA